MFEKKEEALRQINDIRNHLVDKLTFFPYNYKAVYVWAIISLILTFVMIPMYEESILEGTIVTIVFIAIGFATEGFLTKKENENYNIEDCTHRQQFIMKSFFMLSVFGMTFSMVLASYSLYIPIFLLWLFLCSMGYFSVGFVLNIKDFSQIAKFNVLITTLLLGVGYFIKALEGKSNYMIIVQFFVVIGLSILPSIVAWRQIKDEK